MGTVMSLPDKSNVTISSKDDFIYLVYEKLGYEAERYLVEWIAEMTATIEDLQEEITSLENEIYESERV